MKPPVLTCLHSAFIAGTLMIVATTGQAANYSTDVNLQPIVALIEQGRYDSAINLLHDNLCSKDCKEYSTLKKAIDAFQATASNS
jgi:hypothetical protein